MCVLFLKNLQNVFIATKKIAHRHFKPKLITEIDFPVYNSVAGIHL